MADINNINTFRPFIPHNEHQQVQTRSEKTGVIQHISLQSALNAAKTDPTLWKISYNSEDGSRVRYMRSENFTNEFFSDFY